MIDRSKLTTEKRNPRSRHIDRCPTLEIVDIINAEDQRVPRAVSRERKNIARAIDKIVESLKTGGKLFYVGAGTSGRLGVLDASECPPTFGTHPHLVQGIIAGGRRALVRSVEGAEDRAEEGARALQRKKLQSRDVVVGIAACGLTPFVRGALDYATKKGTGTIFLTCAPEVKKIVKAEIVINPVVGPEVVTGSTRMKAGTATKLVLNLLTTGSMIKLGKVYGNLMVDLRATNDKLCDRSRRILAEITGLSKPQAARLLERAQGELKPALVMRFRGVKLPQARQILADCGQSLHQALNSTGRL